MAFTHAKPVNAEPQVRSEIGAAFAVPHDGVPTDADFNRTPPNGTVVVDNTNGGAGAATLYVRVGDAWVAFTADA